MQATSAKQLGNRIQQLETSLGIQEKIKRSSLQEDLLEQQSKSPCLFEDPFKLPAK